MVWRLISPLAPLFRDLYDRSATEVGILVALPALLGSLARISLGLLADRYGHGEVDDAHSSLQKQTEQHLE